ncbi:Mu transposase C-terminal domain-containing protein [Cupriavidus sp. SK-3]|uniref:Mu transposase C-terminal domain-containing protein n=1 Tax=Cupriavidus sp. SK-3 TaxID=1470558 RepID=UPI001F190DFC|nr:Mu transposase C-terminal domain-containing protein [Cupriavidus sp. SK-3]
MMEKVHILPGSTGSSTKGRKARKPEAEAALTLREFEQWLTYETGQTYHHSAHRGLGGATPYSVLLGLSEASRPRLLPDSAAEELRFLIQFLPMSRRTIQAEGLTLFYPHYWHPIFAAWRARNARCRDRVTDGRADLAAGSRALRCLAGKSLRLSGGLLSAFERILPLRRPSNLPRREMVTTVLAASGGLTGEVSRLLNVAAELAILDGREMIDLSHIEQAKNAGL